MTLESFGKKMKYLQIAYPSFKLELDNPMHIEVWYDILGEFEEDYFNTILKDYTKHNEYAPNSPASIIAWAKQMILRNVDMGSKFDKLIQRLRADMYDVDKVAEKYEKGGQSAMAKVVRELSVDVSMWRYDSAQLPFLKNKFEKTYQHYLQLEVDKNVFSITDPSRLLGE